MENETKTPYRARKRGYRRVGIGVWGTAELLRALETEADKQGVSVSTLAANLLAEKMGVPA